MQPKQEISGSRKSGIGPDFCAVRLQRGVPHIEEPNHGIADIAL